MAEPGGAARPSAESTPRPPAERGELVVEDRVLVRVARAAALSVPGVVRYAGALGSVTGRELPRVDATVAGDRVRLGVDVAVGWPAPVGRVAAQTRATVAEQVARISGKTVDEVDVSVATIVVDPERPSPPPLHPGASGRPAGEPRSASSPLADVLPPGPAPRTVPAAVAFGPVFAIALVAAGLALLHDAVALAGWVDSPPWLTQWLRGPAAAEPQPWTTPLGVAIALLGLAVLVLGLRPSRVSEVPVGDGGHIWIRPRDLAGVAQRVARQVPGVVDARSVGGTRAIDVRGTSTVDDTRELRTQVTEAVSARLAPIGNAPPVRVRLRGIGGDR